MSSFQLFFFPNFLKFVWKFKFSWLGLVGRVAVGNFGGCTSVLRDFLAGIKFMEAKSFILSPGIVLSSWLELVLDFCLVISWIFLGIADVSILWGWLRDFL